MRALLCHGCRHRLEAEDDPALLGLLWDHLVRKHPALPTAEEHLRSVVAACAHDESPELVEGRA